MLHDLTEFLCVLVCRVLRVRPWHCLDTEMVTGGDRQTDDRSGVNFYVDRSRATSLLERAGGLCCAGFGGNLQPTDCPGCPSFRMLVPDQHVIDRGFHEVTLVDMGDTAGPAVSIANLSVLRLQWPVPVLDSLSWLQQEYEQLQI